MSLSVFFQRGYVFRQNPVVKVFPDLDDEDANNFGLQLAINTNQFGRTFQDRSLSLPSLPLQFSFSNSLLFTP